MIFLCDEGFEGGGVSEVDFCLFLEEGRQPAVEVAALIYVIDYFEQVGLGLSGLTKLYFKGSFIPLRD